MIIGPIGVFAVYLLIGVYFAHKRVWDIAADATDKNVLMAAAKWVALWPLWVGKP